MTPEDRRAKQRENQDYFSGQVSSLGRYIGFGTLAASFTILTGGSAFAISLSQVASHFLEWSALMGCLTILFDYSQMVLGWFAASSAAGNEAGEYKRTPFSSFASAIQTTMFYGKQITAIAGATFLLIAIGTKISPFG